MVAGLAAAAVLIIGALGAQVLAQQAGPTLTVTKAGTGTGTVTSQPPGIDCGTDCSEEYAAAPSGQGQTVVLTATPNADQTFAGWGGACQGTQTECEVVMSEDRTVSATFNGTGGPDPQPTPSPEPQPTPQPTPPEDIGVAPTPTPAAAPTPTPFGSIRADVFVGTPKADIFRARAGDDVLRGRRGNDLLCGESGQDDVRGEAGNDRLYGDHCPGSKRRVRVAWRDVIKGGSGADLVVGGPGRDDLAGDSGGDRILARDGVPDLVDCGPGDDIVVADRRDRLRRCEHIRIG